MPIFVYEGGIHRSIPSLKPLLRESLQRKSFLDPSLMTDHDRRTCRWIGYGIGKGVSHVRDHVSVFGIPGHATRGLHGELICGFPNVDPTPQCYENDHVLGFGRFIRWVYFADPRSERGILGVDWSLSARKSAGVAHTMLRICALARICLVHGVPPNDELVLLNWRMSENMYAYNLRQSLGLTTVCDWVKIGREMFADGSPYCPRCGLKTLGRLSCFCYRCGCKPQLIREENNNVQT